MTARINGTDGPSSSVAVITGGDPLPEVGVVSGEASRAIPGAACLQWAAPKYPEDFEWVYGVYYGDSEDLASESITPLRRSNRKLTILLFFRA